MADLTRLRVIASSGDLDTVALAAVLYHLSPDPTKSPDLDYSLVESALHWLSQSPLLLFSSVVSNLFRSPEEFSAFCLSVPTARYDDIAYFANAMATPDHTWDRSARNDLTAAVADQTRNAARPLAQSSTEFAVLDLVATSQYDSITHATTAVATMRQTIISRFKVHNRQFKRSRVAISCVINLPGTDETRYILTPWCLSKESAIVYIAVLTKSIFRTVVEAAAIRRGRTTTHFAARSGLEAVRAQLEPALAILATHSYDPERLGFVDSLGRLQYSVQSRSAPAAIALSFILTGGNSDVALKISNMRKALVPPDADIPGYDDYLEETDSVESALLLALRVLEAARHQRDTSVYGPRLNKDTMLGYVARGRRKAERNTAACINRVQEVITLLRSRAVDFTNTLIVIEWGGDIDHATVLAAVAVAKIDVCIDVGLSGIDLPGSNKNAPSQDDVSTFLMLLASAPTRGLPRMPVVEYPTSAGLLQRINVAATTYSPVISPSIVYISGGVSATSDSPVGICSGASVRLSELRSYGASLVFGCSELLLPPACDHVISATPKEVKDSAGQIDELCPDCNSFYRGVYTVSALLANGDVRLVKPRSMYGHNSHLSAEISQHDNAEEDTLDTIDSIVASNALRNYKWGDEPRSIDTGDNPTSARLADLTRPVVATAYKLLSRSSGLADFDNDYADSIAGSLN